MFFFSHHGIGIERHDHPSHAEIGHSQGDDEVVGDVLQGLLLRHGEDDQDIAEHHGDTEDQDQEGPVVFGLFILLSPRISLLTDVHFIFFLRRTENILFSMVTLIVRNH